MLDWNFIIIFGITNSIKTLKDVEINLQVVLLTSFFSRLM